MENVELKTNQEIEDLAWNIFMDKLQISFKRELTPEEKKTVTDKESYEYYRNEARKIIEKRIKAQNNKKYPEINIPADGESGMDGGAYCICFVYSKYKGNVVLKGYRREVKKYLKKNFTHYFCNWSLWYHGQNRDIWDFWKESVGILQPDRSKKRGRRTKWEVYKVDRTKGYGEDERYPKRLFFKRMPKRWIPEFDEL